MIKLIGSEGGPPRAAHVDTGQLRRRAEQVSAFNQAPHWITVRQAWFERRFDLRPGHPPGQHRNWVAQIANRA